MADVNPKGFGSHATVFFSGIAAAATALAAVVGLLTQFGFIGHHDSDKPVASAVTTASAPPAIVNQAAAPSAAPTSPPAEVEDELHRHHKHKRRNAEPDQMIASAGVPSSVAHAEERPGETSRAAASAAPAQQASVAMADASNLPLLAGAWRDANIGACHQIRQEGINFTTTNFEPGSDQVIGHGIGKIDGRTVEINYPKRHTKVELHISSDGKTMRGVAINPKGVFRAMWIYVGTDCSTAG